MLNKSKGNMYGWVTHTWNPIKGRCPYECSYCYMRKIWDRFGWNIPYLDEKCLHDNLGKGKFIFVGSSIDMWADEIPDEWLVKVFQHIILFDDNVYLFQSKNPERFLHFFIKYDRLMPNNVIWGTTIETNRNEIIVTKAPPTYSRYFYMKQIRGRKMVSIEPIMDFDLDEIVRWVEDIEAEFVSIGADSKKHNLPEPPAWKVERLIAKLEKITEVKIKKNLNRILKEE